MNPNRQISEMFAVSFVFRCFHIITRSKSIIAVHFYWFIRNKIDSFVVLDS